PARGVAPAALRRVPDERPHPTRSLRAHAARAVSSFHGPAGRGNALAAIRAAPGRHLRPRLLRGWLRRAESHRLLVLHTLWSRARGPGLDLLRGADPFRTVAPLGGPRGA